MGSAFLLTLVYFDDRPVIIAQGGRTTKLLGIHRWYLLGTQAYTALFAYFAISIVLDMGFGTTSKRFCRLAGMMFAIAWPACLFATGFARLALHSRSSQTGPKTSQPSFGGRPRPLYLYNSNVLFCLGELTLGGRQKLLRWEDLPMAVLFAVFFCASQLQLLRYHSVVSLSMLDMQANRAWLRYTCFCLSFVILYSAGLLVMWVNETAPFGTVPTYVSMMAVLLAFVPLWESKQHADADSIASKLD